ncbi:hypothetical protein ACFLYO_06925 [Chloroflexota bacterium]
MRKILFLLGVTIMLLSFSSIGYTQDTPPITPGIWQGTAEFGTFELTVNPEGTGVSYISFTFEDYTCGGNTLSGGMAIGDQEWEGVPITNNEFTFANPQITVAGMFDADAASASGTWNMDSCSGEWTAETGDSEPVGVSEDIASDDLKLFLCEPANEDSEMVAELFETCDVPYIGQVFFYPNYQTTRDFPYTLTGDINGTSYSFNVWAASGDTTTLHAEIILQQGGTETVLASTLITSESTQYRVLSETVIGPDPETVAGDVVILRITAVEGVDGGIAYADTQSDTTFIQIPPVEPNSSTAMLTESPTDVPPPDSDGDGFADDVDACPNEAGTDDGCPPPPPTATPLPTPTDLSTPVPDSDRDGFADDVDACPNEAGTDNGCPPPPEESAVDLVYGESREGVLTDSSSTLIYTFEGQTDEVINVIATADDDRRFDLALDLFDPDGAVLASNDDHDRFNPAIMGQSLPADGLYTIVVRSVAGDGAFLLELKQVSVGEILYTETFDDNSAYWETDSFDEIVSELRDGVYVIEYSPSEVAYTWIVAPGFGNPSAAPVFTPPYEVQMEVSNMFSRTEQYWLTIVFNAQANYEGWQEIGVYHDGVWVLWSTAREEYVDYGYVEPIDLLDGDTHTLTLRVLTDGLEFLIDDELIGEYSGVLDWDSGTVGFGVAGHPDDTDKIFIEAHFDNIVVREIVED